MSPPPSRIAVIVCSRNRPALLREAVESVLQGSRVPEEIVVVDQSEQARKEGEREALITDLQATLESTNAGLLVTDPPAAACSAPPPLFGVQGRTNHL